MATNEKANEGQAGQQHNSEPAALTPATPKGNVTKWRRFLGLSKAEPELPSTSTKSSTDGDDEIKAKPEKWSMGVLNDRETEEVPGQSTEMVPHCSAALSLKIVRRLNMEHWSSPGLAIG